MMTCNCCPDAKWLGAGLNDSYSIECKITGKRHGIYDACDVMKKSTLATHPRICTNCLVCGEEVEVSYHETLPVKICDKCKAAILYIRDNFTEKK